MSESGTTPEMPAAPAPEADVKTLPAPAVAPALAAPKQPRSLWPVAFSLGFLLLAGGEAYLWYNGQKHQADATTLAVLRAQVDDLRSAAAHTAPAPDSLVAQADLVQKYAMLAAQLNAVQAQVASDHGALAMIQANAADLSKLTQRMVLFNALGAAQLALAAGQPLGQIPGAPDALTRFANEAPPTEAQLRVSFEPAARAADAASLTADGGTGFWARVRLRLEGLITISNGNDVIFGPPAAAALSMARTDLNNGDLAGAVAALQGMSGPAQAAMADWLAQAQALLAARTALLAMAQGA